MTLSIEDENIVTNIKVKFTYKNILYIKDIYIIMNKNMKFYINNKDITQHFIDCTYYCIPPGFKDMKMLVLLGFDNSKKKLALTIIKILENKL